MLIIHLPNLGAGGPTWVVPQGTVPKPGLTEFYSQYQERCC